MRYWRRRHEPFDLEAELKASRPEPSPDFVHRVEARVRDSSRTRAGSSLRVAFVGALTAVMLLTLASVGARQQQTRRRAGWTHHNPALGPAAHRSRGGRVLDQLEALVLVADPLGGRRFLLVAAARLIAVDRAAGRSGHADTTARTAR